MTEADTWVHKHGLDGRTFFTYGEDYPECPKERGCWFKTTKEQAEHLVALREGL